MAHTPRHIDVKVRADLSEFVTALEGMKRAFLALGAAYRAPLQWHPSSMSAARRKDDQGSAALVTTGLSLVLATGVLAFAALVQHVSLSGLLGGLG